MSAFIVCFGRSRRRGKAAPGAWAAAPPPPGPLGSSLPGLVGGHVWEGLEMGREGWLNQVSKATYPCHSVIVYMTGSQGYWENL